MTYYQAYLCIRAYGDGRNYFKDLALYAAWHSIAFHRTKKLPNLKSLLSKGRGDPILDGINERLKDPKTFLKNWKAIFRATSKEDES